MTKLDLQKQIDELKAALAAKGLSPAEQEKKLTELLLRAFEELGMDLENELTEEEKELVDEEIKDDQINPEKILAILPQSREQIEEKLSQKLAEYLALPEKDFEALLATL